MTSDMTTTLMDANQPTTELPEDLRQLVGERELVELALQAAQLLGSSLPQWSGPPERGFSARMLLTLLAYSYAAGIYASEDVARACESDPGANYIHANTWPDEVTLRRFRRNWRPMIELCLRWVLAEVQGVYSVQPSAHSSLGAIVQQKLELAVLMDTANCD